MVQGLLVVVVLMLGATSTAQAIQCQVLPDLLKSGNWSWRLIDSRICWHLGDSDTPRELLEWSAPERTEPPKPVATQSAYKIQCQSHPDKSKPGHWWWRLVDNKQCWFLGERATPRELLLWPASANVEPAKLVETPPNRVAPPQEEPPTQLTLWQRHLIILQIDQASDVDLEFVVEGPWIAAPMSFDFNVGNEFLTHTPMTHWRFIVDQSTH